MRKFAMMATAFVSVAEALYWADRPSGVIKRDHVMLDEQMHELSGILMEQYELINVSHSHV
jgi:hypothetical protein